MKRGTPEHPKVHDLARRLGIAWPHAVGLLELLWHFTARYAIQGNIGKWANEQIANAVGWDGDPDVLVEALVAAGWLDSDDEHRLIVHDWHEHADQSVRKTLRSRGMDFVRPARKRANIGPERSRNDSGTVPETFQKGMVLVAETVGHVGGSLPHKPEPEPEPLPLPEPEPEPEPQPQPPQQTRPATRSQAAAGSALCAGERKNGSINGRHLDWIRAVEQEIALAVGRKPRPDSALKLARQAASMGIHPRYLVGWIQSRARASPPRSDGLFLKAIADLPDWVRRNHAYDSSWDLQEAVACPRCGETVYAFRDTVVPCLCSKFGEEVVA